MSNPLPDDDNVSEDIMAYCKEKQGMTGTTYKNHKSVATRFEQWLQEQEQGKDSILEANPPDVRDWVVELNEEGYQGSTIHQYLMTLRAVFDEWMDSDGDDTVSMLTAELEENPANFNLKDYVDTVTTPEKQQFADNNEGVIYLNPSEVRKLRRHVPAPKVRNELVIKMLVQTGLRRGELSNLECDHLDRENQTVTVTAANSKTNKERTVPYNDLDPELTFWLDGG
jgi:integrase/recombinase XerD